MDCAEKVYRQLLVETPNHPDALHFLGLLTYQRGNHEEAIHLIRRATEVAPKYVDAFNNLGNVLRAAGQLDEASAAYERALQLRPNDVNARSNLGATLSRLGRLDLAETECRRAVELDPRHANARTTLATVLERQLRTEEAIDAARTAIAIEPGHPEACRLAGALLTAAGKVEEAREVYRGWLARDPANPVATHLHAALSGSDVPARASDGYVRSLFDGMAHDFDRHLGALEYRAPDLVANVVSRRLGHVNAELRALDAGCGTGLCGRFLRPRALRLVGVDLSARMLARAAALGLYDELVDAELTGYMNGRPAAFGLIVCADTFCYFGDLSDAFAGAAGALADHGLFVFTVERAEDGSASAGYVLARHGRYAHEASYVRALLQRHGFSRIEMEAASLRIERGKPVAGWVFSAVRAAVDEMGVPG